MNKTYLAVVLTALIILSGCNPQNSNAEELGLEQLVETEVQNQLQQMVAQTLTANPTSTLTPTATITPVPFFEGFEVPAELAMPANYILELGFCPSEVVISEGNPKDFQGCEIERREDRYIAPGEQLTFKNADPINFQIFCNIYHLDGTFIKIDFDNGSKGSILCSP